MSRFTSVLRDLNHKITLPQPQKSRILLEIAADLNDLYEEYRGRGFNESEAAAMAKQTFDISDAALRELMQIHETTFRRFMDKLSVNTRAKYERILLVLMLCCIAVVTSQGIWSMSFFYHASNFVWPIIGMVFIAFTIFIGKFYSLFIEKNHSVHQLRSRLNMLISTAGVSILIGVYGYFWELFRAKSMSVFMGFNIIMITETDIQKTPLLLSDLTEIFMRASFLMVVSMFASMLIAVMWVVLVHKVIKIEQDEAAILLAADSA